MVDFCQVRLECLPIGVYCVLRRERNTEFTSSLLGIFYLLSLSEVENGLKLEVEKIGIWFYARLWAI